MAIFSLKQKIFIVKRYYQTGNSTEKVKTEFPSQFNSYDSQLSSDKIIELVNLFEEFGTVYPKESKQGFVLDEDEYKAAKYEEIAEPVNFPINNRELESENTNDDTTKFESELDLFTGVNSHNDFSEVLVSIKIDELSKYNSIDDNSSRNESSDGSNPLNYDFVEDATVENKKDVNPAVLSCKICHQEFDKEMYLKRHIKAHNKTSCEICGKKYLNRENHMKKHSGEKSYQCTTCGSRFINMSRLNSHMTTHSEERPFDCTTCQKKFKSRERLRVHQKTHTTDRPNKCEVCGKGFLQKYDLKKHLNVHTGERKSICSICGKFFVSNDSLKIHMRCHTGEKPYNCRYCEKHFSSAGVLKIHERIHTGEKPYKCKYCDKEFYDSSTRRAHERTHTGDYPYKCTLCGKAHNHPSNLKSHMRHAHREALITNFK